MHSIAEIPGLIAKGDEDAFYSWPEWRRLKAEVLRLDHFECQECRKKGRYTKGYIVHHINHLKDRPDLALSAFVKNAMRLCIRNRRKNFPHEKFG